jgi:G-patch domain
MADRRNLDWKTNNVGSKLLAKMGWKDGQGVGKRCRDDDDDHDDDEKKLISTEGIRVKRRQTNLGLGATANHSAVLGTVSGSNHAEDFAQALVEFQNIHGGSSTSSGNDVDNDKNNDDDGAMTLQEKQEDKKKKSKDKKKKKKMKKEKKKEDAKGKDQKKKETKDLLIVLPTNKMTHSATRQAKFQEKTRDDLKCIFAGSSESVYSSSTTTGAVVTKKKKTTNRKR